MARPLFLLLAYNQEAYVADAVRSALAQEGPELDILISDDCSHDATFQIIKETTADYSGPHSLTVRCNPRNLGLAEHINSSVEASTAEVIIFAAGDDISEPSRSRKLIGTFDNPTTLLAHSQVQLINKDGEDEAGGKNCTFHGSYGLPDAASSLSLYVGASGACHRSLFEKYGPLPEGVFEDLVLGFRAALEDGSVFIDEPLVKYRSNIGLSSTGTSLDTEAAWRRARKKRLEVYKRVFEARLADAATSGLQASSEICRIINREITDVQMRADLIGSSATKALSKVLTSGPKALVCWQSERNRSRRGIKRAARS